MANQFTANRCVFPQLPLQQGQSDQRSFKQGEPVCLRDNNNNIRPATYIRSDPHLGTGNVFTHVVFDPSFPFVPERFVAWTVLGKYTQFVSPTAVNKLGENKKLPHNIEGLLKKYGGKRTKKSHKTSKKRHAKKRKQTRRK